MGRIWIPGGGGGADLDVVTAGAGEILAGKVIVDKDGNPLTGTMPNQGAKTAALNCGGSYAIPAGYHNGNGKVTANSLASQTPGTAAAAQILSGKTAWVNGVKVTGTMANNGAVAKTITPSASAQSYTVPAGYHNGSGKVSVPAVSNLKAAYIKKGVTVGGVTGTWEGYVTSPLYLYNKGTFSNLQTTGWEGYGVEVSDTGRRLAVSWGDSSSYIYGTYHCCLKQTFNLTDYKYIKATFARVSTDYSNCLGVIAISPSYALSTDLVFQDTGEPDTTYYTAGALAPSVNSTAILDISGITGSYYIYVGIRVYYSGGRNYNTIMSNVYLTNS